MLNSVVLVGRAGQNPEVKYYESGKIYATFNLAVDRPRKRDGERITDWFRIDMWGRLAERANEYIRKGALLGIQGRLEFKKWQDEQGNIKETGYIAAHDFRLLSSRQDTANLQI